MARAACRIERRAHRLTGFSSMDTEIAARASAFGSAHRLTGFSSMDTSSIAERSDVAAFGAPPDGFLIDGHQAIVNRDRHVAWAHRLTGFSSMDTAWPRHSRHWHSGAPPDGFLIDGHGREHSVDARAIPRRTA